MCFIVDQSGSVGQENWRLVINFLENFVNELTISSKATQVGLVTFAAFGELGFSMDDYNDDKDGMIEAITSSSCCRSGTSIDAALYKARTTCFHYGEFVETKHYFNESYNLAYSISYIVFLVLNIARQNL